MSDLYCFYFDILPIVRMKDGEGKRLTAELDEWVNERGILCEVLKDKPHIIMFILDDVVKAIEFKLRMSEWLIEDPYTNHDDRIGSC